MFGGFRNYNYLCGTKIKYLIFQQKRGQVSEQQIIMLELFKTKKVEVVIEKDNILVASGGWECTWPTFYKVMDVKNDYVTIRELNSKRVSHEPFVGTLGSGTELPIDTFKNDKLIRRKINQSTYNDEPYIIIQKSYYLSAHIWDGKPQQYDFRNV
jgi:hypothetical protein